MKRVRWKWLLPAVQFTFALTCHIYEPHEYRVQAQLDHAANNMEYTFQHSPAFWGRVSRGVNFPAMVLAFPLRNEGNAFYRSNSDYTLVWLSPADIGLFLGIVLFWLCVGWMLDERAGPARSIVNRGSVTRISGWSLGIVFGMLTGIYALHMIASKWRPERQIGAAGVAWAILIIGFFTWRATGQHFIPGRVGTA